MTERNITRYHLEQSDNKSYILTTSLINDKLKLACQDSNSQTFVGAFTLMDLLKLSKYFKTTRSVDQVQQYLNGIVEKQRVEIYQDSICIKIILHLINNDKITIPLTNKLINQNTNYYNIPNMPNQISNQYVQTQIPANTIDITNYANATNYTDPQILSSIPQSYVYPQNNNQYLTSQTYNYDQNINGLSNIEIPGINTTINSNINQIASAPVITSSYPQADSSFNYQMKQLENDNNTIRAEQEKISNELKRVLDQAEKFKQENEMLKQENSLLNKENTSLKNENENLRNELNQYKEEYDKIKKEFTSLQNDTVNIQEQNKELLKIKETYENQIQIAQNNLEQLTKDNETLNQNFTLLSKQNESLITENNSLKNAQQKSAYSDEEIKNLMEELSAYRLKAQENELLKKQLEDLQYQIQVLQERQEEDDVK